MYGWIHEQSADDNYKTICGNVVFPFTQTTTKWMNEKPTCPNCRAALAALDAAREGK